MRVAILNGPAPGGASFMREGRCTQESAIWSTQWPPISLAYLAAVAARQGSEVMALDCPAIRVSRRQMSAKLHAFRPDLCLLSIATPTFAFDMATAAAIKEVVPPGVLAVFGVHATTQHREILRDHPQIDAVLRGEPEKTLEELLAVLAGEGDWREIAGLTSRDRVNPDRAFLADLDALPFPAWHALDLRPYRLPFYGRPFLCLAPMRGCPYRCSFCTASAYYGAKLRRRSVESFITELQIDRRHYAVDDFFMWSETFTLDRDYALALCAAMREHTPGIRWTCASRTDTVDGELLDAMRAAGCWMISFGFESTDPDVLHHMKKNLRSPDFATPVRLAREAGLAVLGHFVLGLPGETPRSARRTIRDARAMDLDFAQFYAAAPFVGSPLSAEAIASGWIEADRTAGISQAAASLRLPGLPPPVVDRLRRWAIPIFYFRPRRMYRLARLLGWNLFRPLVAAFAAPVRRRENNPVA